LSHEAWRYGVAHVSPRYNPFPGEDLGPDILLRGAQDAYDLGFRTIKLWIDPWEVRSPWFYSLTEPQRLNLRTPLDVLELPVFQQVLGMPFQAFLLNNDASRLHGGRELSERYLTHRELEAIYWEQYETVKYLLHIYRGTGKTFVLQNHEADWHAVVGGPGAPDRTPSRYGIHNYVSYWMQRQLATNQAREEFGPSSPGVVVYHLAEVTRALESAYNGVVSLASEVLPTLSLDLVGYSAWEALANPDHMQAGIEYLRSVASGGPEVLGDNNVIVTEAGVAERVNWPSTPEVVAACMNRALDMGVPLVVHWNLYDNECSSEQWEDSTTEECGGFWVRRPDGSLGALFELMRFRLADHVSA
jgi:hypothetical protein